MLFVAPDASTPISGGTRYDRELLAALDRAGVACAVVDLAGARSLQGGFDFHWVDSLYLDAFGELAARLRPIGLVLHYLPSLLQYGSELAPSQLTTAERDALALADGFLVPSAYMAGVLERLLGASASARAPILVVEPGCEVRPAATAAPVDGVRALMIANLVENKGVLELLEALRDALRSDDAFELRIVGGARHEPAYAERCRRFAERLPGRIVLEGELPPELVEGRLHASNLMLSASKMESYGMALAEAKAAGIPIIARDAGNARAHVAVGEIVANVDELAERAVALSRSPDVHRAWLARAQELALASRPRSWADAARELASGAARVGRRVRSHAGGGD